VAKSKGTITLKWGTLKGWDVDDDNVPAMELLQRYHDLGSSMSCALQQDTAEQKQILVDLVSLPGMKIYLDWDAKYIGKDAAVKYIQDYSKENAA
jgi:hypothetical protein